MSAWLIIPGCGIRRLKSANTNNGLYHEPLHTHFAFKIHPLRFYLILSSSIDNIYLIPINIALFPAGRFYYLGQNVSAYVCHLQEDETNYDYPLLPLSILQHIFPL
jgi:hypothetical protein